MKTPHRSSPPTLASYESPLIDVLNRLSGALAGRYSLQRELGRGGMATVYLAQDLRHERSIAVKVLHPDLAETLGPERFQREIRVAAQLRLGAGVLRRERMTPN